MRDLVTREGTTAEEILYVLNGLNTVPLHRITFAVITGTYTPSPYSSERQIWPFSPGEIIPITSDLDGAKEFLGQGRPDPQEWEDSGFCVHHVDNLAGALAVAELVRSDRPRGYYAWTGDGPSFAADQDAAHWQWAGDPEGWIRVGDFTGRTPATGNREASDG